MAESSSPMRRRGLLRPKSWLPVAVLVVLFGAAGAVYSVTSSARYDASTLVQIDPTQVTRNVSSNEIATQEISTQVLVVDSDLVVNRVIKALNLDASVQTLHDAVTVQFVNDSRVLRVTVEWDSPGTAPTAQPPSPTRWPCSISNTATRYAPPS